MKSNNKSKQKNNRSSIKNLPPLNLNAAGIDIGSREHFVAIPEGRDENSVRSFKSFTSDLHDLSNWLTICGIETVVMESTGVYWIPLFQILESKGFEVLLVNAHHVKNVPGRKTDVKDCQWLQQLHTFGLLRGSFHPDAQIKKLRTYLRQKDNLVRYTSSHIQHIQKSLTLMNVLIHNVISDITGKSGMRIIRAIIRGERNPDDLVKYCDKRLKNPINIIKKSLEGNYSDDNIFTLKQSVELFDFYNKKIFECDSKICSLLDDFEGKEKNNEISEQNQKVKKKQRTDPEIQRQLIRITSVDLTQITGLNTTSLLTIISETGLDAGKWKTEKHFTSWLGLAPNNKISGGKILSSKSRKVKSRASNAFRMAAQSTGCSKSYLGAFYRKQRYRLGPAKANVATARKIAVIYYNMLKNGTEFYDYGADYFETKYKAKSLKLLKSKAKKLGYEIVLKTMIPQERVS